MSDRRIDAFFYGLFMDIDNLHESGVAPINPRRACGVPSANLFFHKSTLRLLREGAQ